jgi:selenide, water dikinase
VLIDLDSLPVLEGSLWTTAQGFLSTLHGANLKAATAIQNQSAIATHPVYPLLFDPQTSGGLLASLPTAQAASCLAALKDQGYEQSCLVGFVRTAPSDSKLPISFGSMASLRR